MTTPKPKARKAACVWGIEISCDNGKRWELMMYFRTRREAIARVKHPLHPLERGIFRIRKYQRIDK